MMQLFYHLGSCSLASHIRLDEAGADYKAVRVSMAGGGQKTPEYLAPTDPWAFAQVQAFTFSDGYLFTLADWLEGDGIDLARFPKVHAHRERVRVRPAVAKVLAEAAG